MPPTLSLVIPAYNEAARLPRYLVAIREHLDARCGADYEVIVVDDGSTDGTANVIAQAAIDWPQLSLLAHETNRGKGAAVRSGMLAAEGQRLVFADADGATPIAEIDKLLAALDDRGADRGADVAVGSRLLDDDGVTRRRTFGRGLIGRLFARLARAWLGISVRDTQCGFKGFRREAGRRLFEQLEEAGFLFDLELLAAAERSGCRIAEVPVNWSDVPGGHLHPLRQLLKILAGLWRVRRRIAARGIA